MPYADLPEGLRRQIEGALGAPVIAARTCSGGFSPGTAAVLTCADGSRAFLKAVGTPLNPDTPGLHRVEARVAAALPAAIPTPRFRWSTEFAVADDVWIALLFDVADGASPVLPWSRATALRTVDALADLAAAGTPCPIPALEPVTQRFVQDLTMWSELAASPPPDLDAWESENLAWLAGTWDRLQESGGLEGDSLVHLDVRADNLLVQPDGSVLVVDWPWAARGAAWIDTVLFALDPAVHGGIDPEELMRRSPLLHAADPAAVTDLLVGLLGMWADRMRRPAPPGLPTLRAFQRQFHDAALAWVVRRVRAGYASGRAGD